MREAERISAELRRHGETVRIVAEGEAEAFGDCADAEAQRLARLAALWRQLEEGTERPRNWLVEAPRWSIGDRR